VHVRILVDPAADVVLERLPQVRQLVDVAEHGRLAGLPVVPELTAATWRSRSTSDPNRPLQSGHFHPSSCT
jgi:hypothetical protein